MKKLQTGTSEESDLVKSEHLWFRCVVCNASITTASAVSVAPLHCGQYSAPVNESEGCNNSLLRLPDGNIQACGNSVVPGTKYCGDCLPGTPDYRKPVTVSIIAASHCEIEATEFSDGTAHFEVVMPRLRN